MSRKNIKKQNNNSVIRWGIYATAFIIVVAILVSKFLIVGRKNSEKNIKNSILSEMENSAIKFESRIIKIESLGKGAATIIEKTDSLTSAQREAYAKHIADTVPEIYMAAVLDSYGKGFNSYGDEIDLAKKAYYEPSTSSTFSYTKNDEIMGKSAYVWTVPLLRDDAISGHICLFMEDSTLAEILPKEGYGGNISIALIDGSVK